MVVDDSLVMRRILKAYFAQIGHNVVAEANGGEQALLYYDAYKPDLVTLDITMPGDDGTVILKHLIKKNPELKIIIVSAVTKKSTIMEALAGGAKYYILKPFTFEKIVSAVRGVFGDVEKEEVIKRAEEEVEFAIKEEESESVLNNISEMKKPEITPIRGFSYSANIEAMEGVSVAHIGDYKKMINDVLASNVEFINIDFGKVKDDVAEVIGEVKKITEGSLKNKQVKYSIIEPNSGN